MECKDKPFNIKYTFSLNSHYELWQAKYNLVQLYNNIKKSSTNKGNSTINDCINSLNVLTLSFSQDIL